MDLVGGRPTAKRCGSCDKLWPEVKLQENTFFAYKNRSSKLCADCNNIINDLMDLFSKEIDGKKYVSDEKTGHICKTFSKMMRRIPYDEHFFRGLTFKF